MKYVSIQYNCLYTKSVFKSKIVLALVFKPLCFVHQSLSVPQESLPSGSKRARRQHSTESKLHENNVQFTSLFYSVQLYSIFFASY